MDFIAQYLSSQLMKIMLFAAILFIAYKWSNGSLNKDVKKLKRFKNRYGFVTVMILIIWWTMIPMGTPDDIFTLWAINYLTISGYILIFLAITAYLIWRLRVTIVIYQK